MKNLEKNFIKMNADERKEIVKSTIEDVFHNDDSHNVGTIENHCDKKTKEYYLGLANNDEKAIRKKEGMLKEFINGNISRKETKVEEKK